MIGPEDRSDSAPAAPPPLARRARGGKVGYMFWMANDRASCGRQEELVRTTDFRISRCGCGTVHLHLNKAGVTVQLTETMLAELVNATSIAQRKVEGRPADPVRSPSPSTPTN